MSAAARPLRERPLDVVYLVFFVINFGFITYMIDIEQIVIADPARFVYPIWPPRFAVDLIHWWALRFDPVVWHRAPWYRATIWIDSLVFGPFYLAAIYAFVRAKNWIRVPALVWAGMMISIVTIILFEELAGPTPTPAPGIVAGANLPWLLFPFAVVWRMRKDGPFDPD